MSGAVEFEKRWKEVHGDKPSDPAWDGIDAIFAEECVRMNDAGFTHEDFASRYKLTPDQARKRCARLAAKGRLTAGWRTLSNGRTVRVFRIPTGQVGSPDEEKADSYVWRNRVTTGTDRTT